MSEIVTALAAGGASGISMSAAGWFFFRRWISRLDTERDALRNEVRKLRDVQVRKLEQDLAEHESLDDERHRKASESRKAIHQEVAKLDRDKVNWVDCNRMHEGYAAQLQELARVGERVDAASRRNEDLFNRVISVKQDIDRMIGRVEALEKERK